MLSRIVLSGFMGSGKSTVGRQLAASLGWSFLDLDTFIEERTGSSVPEIFATQGEARFRDIESAALAEALMHTKMVLALGGGAPEIASNREQLASAPDTAVIYLAAPFTVLYERCTEQALDPTATARPNMVTREHAEIRFLRRQPHYEAIATHTVESATQTAEETTGVILRLLALSNRA